MRLDQLVAELDAYFRVADVRGDFPFVQEVYPPYWRDLVEPSYPERWNEGTVSASVT